MLSNSMFLPGDRQLLQQKVFILQEELQDYKMKESKLSKLNQSILQTYKFSQNIKETQQNQTKRQNRQLITKHREQIRKLKTQFTKDKFHLQNQNINLKQKLKLLEDALEKTKFQHQRHLIDVKTTLENKIQKIIEEMQNKHNSQMKIFNQETNQKISEFQTYIEQLENQNELYQEYIQRKQELQKENNPKRSNINEQTYLKKSYQIQIQGKNGYDPSGFKPVKLRPDEIQNPLYSNFTNIHFHHQPEPQEKYEIKTVPKESKRLISELSTRLNRAIKEINQIKYPHYS